MLAAACGRAHDLGSDTTTTTTMAAGGMGGATSSASSAASSSSTGGAGGGGIVEPPGPTELTVVNGINDYPSVRLCFLPNDTPWPSAPAGLPFAGSQVIAPLSSALPASGDVTPWVIAGDLTQAAGKTCTQILAIAGGGAGALVARPLAVIPEAVFAANRSLLLVPNGCVGGNGHDDPSAKQACGMGYDANTPTATVALAAMSRLGTPGKVSFQVASASPALPEVDVKIVPNVMMAMPATIAPSISQGAIGPLPPFDMFSPAELGPPDGVQIQTFTPGSQYMTSAVPLSDVFANGGPGAAAVTAGARLALVAVGSAPGLPAAKWWHGLTYAMVKREPQ